MLQEGDRFEIFPAAELIGDPLTGFTRIVQIKHGGDRIRAQAGEMIFVDPEQRVRNEKVLNFIASVVEDERSPVGLLALLGVSMLVEMRAVEISQPVGVARKMRRSPIEQHTDAFLMAAIDEIHEVG